MKRKWAGVVMATALPCFGSAQGLYLATSWASISTERAKCTVNAQAALVGAGLGQGVTASQGVVYGNDGAYLASVVCATDNDTLVVSVAGPESKRAQTLAQAIRDGFLELP